MSSSEAPVVAAVAPVPADTSSALSVSGGQAHRHMVTRTMRSQDIKDEIHSRATEKALNYGFRGALIGIATTFLLSKSSAWFDRRPRVFKTIFALVFPMVGFTVGGEHEALRLERELAYEKSYVKVAGIPGMPTPEPSALEEELAAIRAGQAPLVTADSLKNYVVENQFKLLFSLWGSLVSSSLIYLLANQKMPVAQKIIHARLIAQGGALSAFIGLAFFGVRKTRRESAEDRVNDRYFSETVANTDQNPLPPFKQYENETPWQRAERYCARAKADYVKCLAENPSRGCVEKEDVLLQCQGRNLAHAPFRAWMTCHRAVRTTGSFEGKENCDVYRDTLKLAILATKDD